MVGRRGGEQRKGGGREEGGGRRGEISTLQRKATATACMLQGQGI